MNLLETLSNHTSVGFFSPESVTVNEDETVNVTVGLMSDSLCDFGEVMINFTTNGSDEAGMWLNDSS